jgi:hypothetical protein
VLSIIKQNLILNLIFVLSFAGSMMGDAFRVCFQACRKSCCKQRTAGFFDPARHNYGGNFSNNTVDGVIAVVRVLPIFFFIIMYWAIYSQVRIQLPLVRMRISLVESSMVCGVAMLCVIVILNVTDAVNVLPARGENGPPRWRQSGAGGHVERLQHRSHHDPHSHPGQSDLSLFPEN